MLYGRFVAGEASDGDVVDTIRDCAALKPLRYDDRVVSFEVALILAGLEEALPGLSTAETPPSPLLDRYRNWNRTDREMFEDDESDDPARLAETKHARRVASIVEGMIQRERGLIGFSHAVRRLELLSHTLIDNQPISAAANS